MIYKNKKLALASMLGLLSTPIWASGFLLPPAVTGNLIAIETDCECILEITPNKKISKLLEEYDILKAINNHEYGYAYYKDITFSNRGIVTLKDGSVIFPVGAFEDDENDDNNGDPDTDKEFLLKLDSYGNLTVLFDSDDVDQPPYPADAIDFDFEGVVLGFDGNLYLGVDGQSNNEENQTNFLDDIYRINPYSGYSSVFATKAEFDALGKDFDFDIQPAITADDRYIYVASDDTPNAVFRKAYKNGRAEIFAVGPNVNPHSLEKEFFIWLENNDYNPYLSNKKYYPKDKDAPFKPTNISGKFTITLSHGDYDQTTYPIPWDAKPNIVAKAISKAIGKKVAVMGRGTPGQPWTFDLPDGYDIDGINDDYIYGASIQNERDDDGGREANEANSHIEALAIDAKYGTLKDIEITARIADDDETISDEFDLEVGESAASVKTKIIENSLLSQYDVDVTGHGTLKSPWIFKFKGDFNRTEIEFNFNGYEYIQEEDVRTGTIQDARAFDDPDGFMTRKHDAYITLEDDSSAHFLYNIDPRGKVSTLVTEWEFILANKGPVDIEGGLAYDNKGYLYVSNHNDNDNDKGGNIFKLSPAGHLSIWIDAEDITKITYGDEEDVAVEGVAFAQSSGFKSSYSSPWKY
ncbi:hypothetical protein [Photobacterium sp. DNB22_13_2]